MSSTLALALQITALNGASSVLNKVSSDTRNLAKRADEVKQHFSDAWIEVAKGAAAFHYGLGKMGGLVRPAADLEEAMLNVRSNLGTSTMAAADLNAQLKKVAATSDIIAGKTRISKVGATNIQNELYKGGMSQEDVGGEKGAAMSVATLATLSKMDEGTAASNIVNIGSMFDLKKEQYGELADMLVRVDDAAATNIPKLVYGLQQAGFSAKALGENTKSTTIALAMLSPLGEMAGTSLNRMLENTTGKTPRAQKAMIELGVATEKAGKFQSGFFKDGKFIGIAKTLDLIRTKLAAVKDDGQRLLLAEKIFGEEGGRAALAALIAGKGYAEIQKGMEDSYTAAQKLDILMGGMNAQTDRFKNSWSSLMAEVFDPLKGTFTEILKGMADSANKLQKFASTSETTKNIVSGTAAVVGAGVLAYGVTKYGKAAVGAVKGFGGTAAGIAEGKAIEAATGVTPVFVTNFAQMNGGGGAANTATDLAATAAAAATGPGLFKTIATGAKWLAYSTLPEIASLGAGAIAASAAMVAAAGALGYGAGTVIDKSAEHLAKGTSMEGWGADVIGGSIAKIFAFFGDKSDQHNLDINEQMDKIVQGINDRPLQVNVSIGDQQLAQVINSVNARDSRRN
jgi:TP901 family phage tail tape measure protein